MGNPSTTALFPHWGHRLDTTRSNELLVSLSLLHLSRAPCETATRLSALLTERRWLDVCNFEVDYTALSCNEALQIRQALAFFTKRDDLDLGVDKKAAAFSTFDAMERLCEETNEIFRMRERGAFAFAPRVESALSGASRKISHILGRVPSLSQLRLAFGPGATTEVKRSESSPRRKLGAAFACSEDVLPSLVDLMAEMPEWSRGDASRGPCPLPVVAIQRGRIASVPKTAKTDRTISVEPMLNGMVQLGIGSHLARRLRGAGVDIRDQTRNQRLARKGSITGELATLDLSSASDTVSFGLVLDLLPIDWVEFLSRFRTGTVEDRGSIRTLAKFSTMGNGYTFPLETLIFFSLAMSVCEDLGLCVEDVAVYGDDIIVPVAAYEALCEVLLAVGFLPNRSKSFAAGPFRESCGADYYKGINIRPCFIKAPLATPDVFRLHNCYVENYDDEAAAICSSWLDPSIRIFGPARYGDGHLHGDHPTRPHGRDRQWGGYTFETFTDKSRKSFSVSPGDRVLPSYSIYASGPAQGLPGVSPDVLDRLAIATPLLTQKRRYLAHPWYDGRQSVFLGRDSESFGVTLPGTKGYKRVKIYTLDCT